MGLKFLGFHAKLKWNTSKAKKVKEKSTNEVVCLRYTFNQNAFDSADSPSTSSRPIQNGNVFQPVPPRPRRLISPHDVKLPPLKPTTSYSDIPPPVTARTDVKPNYNREQSEDAEYIEVFNYNHHSRDEEPDEKIPDKIETEPPIEARNVPRTVRFDENLQEIRRNTELDFNEDGNWNLTVKPQETPSANGSASANKEPYRMTLHDFESAETDSEYEEEEISTPVKTLTVGGSHLSSHAANIFFGSSDDKPQPTPRKVNFFGRNSNSSQGSEASA